VAALPYPVVPSHFRQLTVYQRSVELAHELHYAVGHWPLLDRKTVGPQLIRAATSVGANIAEASGRWHERDRRQLLFIARGSLYETEHWVVYSEQRGLVARGTADRIDEISRLLNGLIKTTPK
jgi:four helix bundle protein